MKLIVGLGNPGRIYALSRHNIGFRILKDFAKERKIKFKKDKTQLYKKAEYTIEDKKIFFLLPLTYMNFSGQAVRAFLEKHKLNLKEILVIHDDMDLELGRLKLVAEGGSGGHRGVESIIQCLGTSKFNRLKIGIGKPLNKEPRNFVLEKFSTEEEAVIKSVIEKAKNAMLSWVRQGIEKTMSVFNAR
ncbi:MAG: aminoacyl-tRNA hydrolase [Candidatus Omnitrophica bacterium]|nr:aminoacyl-tRNA hydrolase [Candidatus Omnitrophota bacterium]